MITWDLTEKEKTNSRCHCPFCPTPSVVVFLNTYLLRWGHKVDGSVVIIIFLDETEGELVVYQEVVYLEHQRGKKGLRSSFSMVQQYSLHKKDNGYRQSKLPEVAYTTRDYCDSSINMQRFVLCNIIETNFQETDWLIETSEIKMSVIKSNDCNQGAQFSHQAEVRIPDPDSKL